MELDAFTVKKVEKVVVVVVIIFQLDAVAAIESLRDVPLRPITI
jgi:hypothetical protein